jgi:hypothetical protein
MLIFIEAMVFYAILPGDFLFPIFMRANGYIFENIGNKSSKKNKQFLFVTVIIADA